MRYVTFQTRSKELRRHAPRVSAQSLHASPASIEIGPDHRIKVSFSGASGAVDDAIGLYNSSTQKRITYQWLKSQKSGTLEFAAPQEPGTYEFQMWIQNWKSKAATSNKVVIKWGPVGLNVGVGDADAQGKRRIHIEFTGAPGYRDDTIGIFRAGTTTKLKYQYLNGAKDGSIEIGGIDENELIEVQLWGNSWRKMLAKTQPFIPKNGPPPPVEKEPSKHIEGQIVIVLTIGSKNAYVNNTLVVLDVPPFIDSGRTFVPFRFVGESLGADVGFTKDASERVDTVTYKLDATFIVLYIGKREATVNGKTVYLDVAPKIVQGRTVIPLRFVTEALGCKVDWDGVKMQVTIKYPA